MLVSTILRYQPLRSGGSRLSHHPAIRPTAPRVVGNVPQNNASHAAKERPVASKLVAWCVHTARTGTAYQLLAEHPRTQNWSDAVGLFYRACTVSSGFSKPKLHEQLAILERLNLNTWTASLAYFSIIKGAARVDPVPQRVVTTMMENTRVRGGVRMANYLIETDLQSAMTGKTEMTPDTARALMAHYASTGLWEAAMDMMGKWGRLQRSPTCVGLLVGCVAQAHSVAKACEVRVVLRALRAQHMTDPNAAGTTDLERWSNPGLVSFPNARLLRFVKLLPGVEWYEFACQLVAETLATGLPLDIPMFLPIAAMMNRRSLWREALSTMVGRFRVLDEGLSRFPVTVTTTVKNSLQHIDPYYRVSPPRLVEHVAGQIHATATPTLLDPRFGLVFPNAVHSNFHALTLPVSKAIAALFPEVRVFVAVPTSLMQNALDASDALIVLDTNILAHCAYRNISLRTLCGQIRVVYPHLKDKPLKHFVVPSTVVLECRRVIMLRERTKIGAKRLLWGRVVRILKETTVLSFASEFPSCSFNIISSMVMRGSVHRHAAIVHHGSKNPDENIVNLCLWLQAHARRERLRHEQFVSGNISQGSFYGAFLRFHVRRMVGQVLSPGCDSLVLMTYDRDLSRRADCLGIDTFPRFSGESSRCVRKPTAPESPVPEPNTVTVSA